MGNRRLNYYVGGQIITHAHLEKSMYLLGYLPKEDRVYLIDKQKNIVSYHILLSILQYQTAVNRGDMDMASQILKSIPESEHSNVARFLETQGYKEEALAVSRDSDQKFDLALELKKLNLAQDILEKLPANERETTDTYTKWKKLGDLALTQSEFALAEKCSIESSDMSGLMLLYTSLGNYAGMEMLAEKSLKLGKTNVAFATLFLLGKVEQCIELLIKTERVPEAAFLARSYMPSLIPKCVQLWKDDLKKVSEDAAKALADSEVNADFFPELQTALQVEKLFLQNRNTIISSSTFPTAKDQLQFDLIDMVKKSSDVLVSLESPGNKTSTEQSGKNEVDEAKKLEEEALMKRQLEEEERKREKVLEEQKRQEDERLEEERKAHARALQREKEEQKAEEIEMLRKKELKAKEIALQREKELQKERKCN